MAIDLVDYEKKAKEAIQAFWGNREKAQQKHNEAEKIDRGERGSVTAGKNMDGFISLITDIVEANGLPYTTIHRQRRVVTLPGYFRPTKLWDLLIVHEQRLVAALELKSHVGPSFGNNFNNRAEEAIGTAHDLRVAYEKEAFGKHAAPFVGWLILVEDALDSNSPVRDSSPHFPVFPEFQGASYLERYNILCQKLIQQQLYTRASIIASPRTAINTGAYSELHAMTGLKNFVTSLAGHIAIEAARTTVIAVTTTMNRVPLYDLRASAGNFSELQQVENKEWVSVPDEVRVSDDLFACKVVGESMNEVIPNGSICLFSKYSGGSRDGKVVLVQQASLQDTEMGAGYTVKEYHSTKKYGEDGAWSHDTITLRPLSDDAGYEAIELQPDEASSLKVLGIFVRVLQVNDGGE